MEENVVVSDKVLKHDLDIKRKNIFILGLIGIAIGVIGAMVMSTLIVVSIIVLLVAVLRWVSLYKASAKIINALLIEEFENCTFDQQGLFNVSEFDGMDFAQRAQYSEGANLLRGDYKGIHFKVGNLRTYDIIITRDSKGKTRRKEKTRFNGVVVKINLDINQEHGIHLRERGLLFSAHGAKHLEKVKTEWIEFNKKFNIYSDSAHHVFYLFTPQFLEAIAMVEKRWHGKVSINFRNNSFEMALSDGNKLFDQEGLNSHSSNIKSIKKEIQSLKDLIDMMRKNTKLFNK